MRMKQSIISHFFKKSRLYLFTIGLFAIFFVALYVYAAVGFTSIGYVWMVTVFCGAALVLLFPWGYQETEPFAKGWYTGEVLLYTLVSGGLCWYGFGHHSTLVGIVALTISLFILVFLAVPLLKFREELHKEA